MEYPLTSTRAPGLLWLTVALAAALLPLDPTQHIVVAVAAALIAVLLPQPASVRVVSALAMIPIGFADAPAWSFVAAGGLLAMCLARSSAATVASPLERIQRHLEWCRRRNETSHLLWVHAPQIDRDTATAALDAFRITDAAALLHEGDGGEEIVAMVDDTSFEREGLERRLRAQVGKDAGFGWATFPDDGVTLDVLFHQARAAAVASTTVQPIRPNAQLTAHFRRLGTRHPAGVPARTSNEG
jgi:hypothetical protein